MTREPATIGWAARGSGVSAKMIRHYESIGLIPRAARSDAGYRRYGANDIHTLRFIRRARDLGFSIRQIGALLALWRDKRRASGKVKGLALAQVAALDARISEMEEMKRELLRLAAHCHGDTRPECPILDGLAEDGEEPPGPTGRKARLPALRN